MPRSATAAVVSLQLGGELALGGLVWLGTRTATFIGPGLAGFAVVATAVFVVARAAPRSRAWARQLARGSGLVHAAVAAVAYVAAWRAQPELYEFPAAGLPLAAVAVALLVGGIAFALTTCGADRGIHAAGGYADDAAAGVTPTASFREPPPVD